MLATVPPSLWSRWRQGTLTDPVWREKLDRIPRWCHRLLRIFQQMRTYSLPLVQGGVLEHPVRWLAAWDVVEDEVRQLQEHDQARHEALQRVRQARGL